MANNYFEYTNENIIFQYHKFISFPLSTYLQVKPSMPEHLLWNYKNEPFV